MGAATRAFDWNSSPLGPPESWPEALKAAVGIVLGSGQPMFVVWGPWRTLIYNDAYAAILASKHPSALGRDFLEVWSEIRADLEPIVEKTFAGEPVQMDDLPLMMLRRGYLEEAHFSFFYAPVRLATGDVAGLFCACNEITAQVEFGRRAELERERMRLMLGQMPGFIAMLSGPEHRFDYVNGSYETLTGRRDLVGLTVAEALPEVAGQGYFELLDRVFTTGEPHVARNSPILLGPSLEIRLVDFLYHPIRDDEGEITGIFVGGYDVTERVLSERELSASEARFRAVQETSADGFMILEATRGVDGAISDFRWAYTNAAAERIIGKPKGWFAGRQLLEEMPGNREAGLFAAYVQVVESGEPFQAEIDYDRDGVRAYLRLSASKVDDGFAVSFVDLTERRRAEQQLQASEARARDYAELLEQIIETTPEPIWTKDADGRFQIVNTAAAEVMGRGRAAIRGMRDADFVPEPLAAVLREEESRILKGGETIRIEETIPHFGLGEDRTFWSTKAPIRDGAGEIVGLVGLARDITERQLIDAQLRDTAERIQLALDAGAIAGTWVWDVPEDRFVADELFAKTFGLDRDACRAGVSIGIVMEAIHPDDRAAVHETIQAALRDGGKYRAQYRIRRAGEKVDHWVEASGRVELSDEGAPLRFPGVLLDIDERRAAEAQRDQAVRMLEIFSEAVPGVVYAKDHEGRMLLANQGTSELVGKPLSELIGKTDLEFLEDKEQAAVIMATDRRIMDSGRAEMVEEEVRRPNGELACWLSSKAPLRDEAGQVIGLIGASIDISDRKRTEALLKESQERLRVLNATLEQRVAAAAADLDRVWRNSRDLLVVVGADGFFRSVSPSWQTVLGHSPSEVEGRSFRDFVWPLDEELTQEGLDAASAARDLTDFENRYKHKDGGYRWLSWQTSSEGDVVYAYGRDITEQKARLEELQLVQEALRQSQKLESMGQLTGGVAHDFNNLLMPIIAGLDILQRRGLVDERSNRLVEGALQSAERAKVLVQRLLAFARRQPLQPKPVAVAELVEGMVDLLASTSGPRVRLGVDLGEDLPPVKADANQLEMALLNLAVNARDAMPDGGQITIAAEAVEIRRSHRTGLPSGDYVRLAVSDTGTGMDEATISRAIEPFFSTKGIGKGTGLGLSMVHGLAGQLGGSLTIQSRVGVGTTVEMWLPVALNPISAEVDDEPGEPFRPAGTALLVDDEDLVRASTAEMLSELGYGVVEASSAEEALGLLDGGLVPDVVVTDHLMPGMSGEDLVRVLQGRRPQLRSLIVSGYAEDEGLSPDLPRLTKPFRQAELMTALGRLLEPR